MFTAAFDVDGTLINLDDTPRYDVIRLFHALESLGCTMVIWSGGGVDYAMRWRDKLGLNASVIRKGQIQADLAVDDFPSDDLENEKIKSVLGRVLLKV
jgi:hydroxymethylpyrimidine pyrophosphatase-like HAD family hydrolase